VPPIQKGITKKEKWRVEDPNIPSAIRPVPDCEGLPIPEPPDSFSLDCDEEEKNTPEETPQPSTSRALEFFLNVTSAEPHKTTQKELSDLIRDLHIELSKNKAELLSSGRHCESDKISLPPKIFSLKSVLLHRGNVMPSIPVAYAVHKQETYENVKAILSYTSHINGIFAVI
jgi:hypothetical protein